MNKNVSGISLTGLSLLLLAGCASSSKSVGTAYVSPTLYKDHSCEELHEEATHISQRVEELALSLDNEAMKDAAQTGGAFVLVPFTLGLSLGLLGALEGGDGPEATEYARLKGEYEAVHKAAKRKKCRL